MKFSWLLPLIVVAVMPAQLAAQRQPRQNERPRVEQQRTEREDTIRRRLWRAQQMQRTRNPRGETRAAVPERFQRMVRRHLIRMHLRRLAAQRGAAPLTGRQPGALRGRAQLELRRGGNDMRRRPMRQRGQTERGTPRSGRPV